jgi:hypothetical protein
MPEAVEWCIDNRHIDSYGIGKKLIIYKEAGGREKSLESSPNVVMRINQKLHLGLDRKLNVASLCKTLFLPFVYLSACPCSLLVAWWLKKS